MNKEKALFEITQTRGEMSRSILESISISILGLLLFIGAPSVFPEIINPYLPSSLTIMQSFLIVPAVFFVAAYLGNMLRYYKILKLQDKLSSKK